MVETTHPCAGLACQSTTRGSTALGGGDRAVSVQLSVSLLLVPAVLLCALMAIWVGFGMALAIPNGP